MWGITEQHKNLFTAKSAKFREDLFLSREEEMAVIDVYETEWV